MKRILFVTMIATLFLVGSGCTKHDPLGSRVPTMPGPPKDPPKPSGFQVEPAKEPRKN